MARAYYNEIDPFAAQWLRNLISAGLIPPGDVDERSIVDVRPADLRGYTQCHFFAGIAGWSLALRLAGWPDDKPVWTGSCPCQPFSGAGLRKGHEDERHLWPAFYGLIAECQPATVFGEQVASKDGREWLAAVRADLEKLGHAVGAADLCAAGGGAPHIRQRLFWVAHAASAGSFSSAHRRVCGSEEGGWPRDGEPQRPGAAGGVAHAHGRDASTEGVQRGGEHGQQPEDGGIGRLGNADRQGRDARQPAAEADRYRGAAGPDGGSFRLGDADRERKSALGGLCGRPDPELARGREVDGLVGEINVGWPGAHHGGWSDADWLFCTDGKWRPVEPGAFPLAHGVRGRVGRLRAYGNAIVPQVAACFIAAFQDILTMEAA